MAMDGTTIEARMSAGRGTTRTAAVLLVLMCLASVVATLARPTPKARSEPAFSLEAMIPQKFGDWREQTTPSALVVNPQTQELLNRVYSQILTRVYISADGYRIMLSIAYGSDQRGALQAHRPEVCYPSQGFTVHWNVAALLGTSYGDIPVYRLYTSRGPRQEPVTYWFAEGDAAIHSRLQKKLLEIRFGLSGQIPDGLIFRVSSIDADQGRAMQMQDRFVDQLLRSIPQSDRTRLSGLAG